VPEIRQNPATKEWVLIATERAKRPEDFVGGKREEEPVPDFSPECPFCPGNEESTPPEIAANRRNGTWSLRVVPNKFPALVPVGEDVREEEQSFFRRMNGLGQHEVIIATPVVPLHIRHRLEEATRFFDDHGQCVFCRIIEMERKERERVVMDDGDFLIIEPFAARFPFETWILPREHHATFGEVRNGELERFARILNRLLEKLGRGLCCPAYNMVIRTAPSGEEGEEYYHWHVQIMPRLTTPAGFELGTGVFINTTLPEATAEFLRRA